MNKLIRIYNQNRVQIFVGILIVAFIFLIIQFFNYLAGKELEEQSRSAVSQDTTGERTYTQESESIISEGEISSEVRKDFGQVIDEFLNFCKIGKYIEAYSMLTDDTTRLFYQTPASFENSYCKDKFQGDKEYSFQSWINLGDIQVYQVKIFDNILATGNRNDTYIEDFVTVINEGTGYGINVDGYITNNYINVEAVQNDISVRVISSDTYLDYEIYTLEVKNNTGKRIMLDTRKDTDSVYVVDNRDNQFPSFLYENAESDLIYNPNEIKKIEIKFSDAFRENMEIKEINFNNIILDYDKYLEGSGSENISLKIEM